MPAGTNFLGPVSHMTRNDYTPRQWFGGLPIGESPDYCVQFNDYVKATDYSTTDYTLTLVGTGTAAVSTTSAENGALVLTTTNSSSDSNSLQAKQEAWKLVAGKQLWFECKVQTSNVADVDLFIGLASTDTTPLDATDRVGFRMTNGAATLNYETSVGGTATSATTGQSLVAATSATLSIWWDGATLRFFVNRNLVVATQTNVATAAMALTAHIKTNSANARTATIDYFFVAKER